MITHEKLTAFLETLPKGELLMRGDSVAFPPGGCAYLHRHQGPGHPLPGRRRHPHRHAWPLDVLWTRAAPGTNPAPTPCSRRRPPTNRSRFIRVMILPRELAGKSSIQYVNEERQGETEVAAVQNLRRRADFIFVRGAQVTVIAAMTSIDRQQAFSGTKEAAPALAARCRAARTLSRRADRGLRRAADDQAIQRRAIEPDLSAGDAGAALCAAPQAARQAAAVGARRRPRISRDPRAARARFSGRRTAGSIAPTTASPARRSMSWTLSMAACSGSRRCRDPTRPSAPPSTTP